MKTEIKTETVEVIKQVRLSTNQRLTIISMSNTGGRGTDHMDWGTRTNLLALGLIEERDFNTPSERLASLREIDKLWKSVPALVSFQKIEELSKLIDTIERKTRDLDRKCYWLTPAAKEYLTKGKVTIVR